MATRLLKNVRRELIAENRYGGSLVIELQPGDVIEFRQKGKRTRYSISLHNVFLAAVMASMQAVHAEKMKRHKEHRGRKPRALNLSHFPAVLRHAVNTK